MVQRQNGKNVKFWRRWGKNIGRKICYLDTLLGWRWRWWHAEDLGVPLASHCKFRPYMIWHICVFSFKPHIGHIYMVNMPDMGCDGKYTDMPNHTSLKFARGKQLAWPHNCSPAPCEFIRYRAWQFNLFWPKTHIEWIHRGEATMIPGLRHTEHRAELVCLPLANYDDMRFGISVYFPLNPISGIFTW